MLYIRGHKIIKGYIGNTPISHVGFGKSGLIKIKSENGGSDYPNNLIAKYTTNTSGVLPTFNSGYQYTVNETESNGVYTVELFSDSDFTSCNFKDKTGLLTVDYLKVTDKVTSMNRMFSNCNKLTSLDVSNFNTSQVTNMKHMFKDCKNLTSLDVSNFNTSNVTDMQYMFRDCRNLTSLDVSNFNTSNVTDMQYMFEDCHNIISLNLSNFDTSNVTNMTQMINECYNLTELNISNWHLKSEVDVTDIFKDTNVLTNVIMNNSDYNSVNKIIAVLPTITSGASYLDITGVDDISLVDEETLSSKNWALSNVGH